MAGRVRQPPTPTRPPSLRCAPLRRPPSPFGEGIRAARMHRQKLRRGAAEREVNCFLSTCSNPSPEGGPPKGEGGRRRRPGGGCLTLECRSRFLTQVSDAVGLTAPAGIAQSNDRARKFSDHCQRLLPGGRREGAVEVGEVLRGEANVERGPVLAHMRRPGRLWDRADAVLAEHPGERHLRRGHALVPRRDRHEPGSRKSRTPRMFTGLETLQLAPAACPRLPSHRP
jgi:hypothetical protein